MGKFHEPLIIPFVAFATGIFLSSCVRMDRTDLILAFALFALAGMVARLATPRRQWIAWACCIAVVGSAVAEFHRRGPAPEMASEAGELLMVSGCVVEPLSFLEDRGRFTVEIEPGARVSASLRADADKPRPVVPFGTMVEFPARVRKPRNFGNPGAFDYVRYLARRNTYWLATVQTHAEVAISRHALCDGVGCSGAPISSGGAVSSGRIVFSQYGGFHAGAAAWGR